MYIALKNLKDDNTRTLHLFINNTADYKQLLLQQLLLQTTKSFTPLL
jgi:hypothetical protein